MLSTSVYAINQAEPTKWMPGELQAASAFIGMALWLAIDVLFCVNRVFKKKQGLYFWSITLGMLFLILELIGDIVKFLTPNTEHLWPLYTLFMLVGWAVYPQCQLLVLYSRLHLVNDVPWIRKAILWAIVAIEIVGVLPTWVVNWHSYNPNPKINTLWSPRTSIVERYNQVIVIVVEIFISATYIYSLLKILKGRTGVRQRRVMHDLIYTNILVVSFDVVTVTLYYLNQMGISHPVQVFTYALKLKVEFLVLNQLMIVAARGVRKKAWEEKRYLEEEKKPSFSTQAQTWASKPSPFHAHQSPKKHQGSLDTSISVDFDPKARGASPTTDQEIDEKGRSLSAFSSSTLGSDIPPTPPPKAYKALGSAFSEESSDTQEHHPSQSSTSPFTLKQTSSQSQDSKSRFSALQRHAPQKRPGLKHTVPRSKYSVDTSRTHDSHQQPKPKPESQKNPYDDEIDDEEIEFHMWERRGTVLLYAPWMKQPVEVEKNGLYAV